MILAAPGAVPSPTPATTLQFYGGEVRAVAQIGTTVYVGGSFTSVGYGSGTIARSHLVALDATTGLHVPGLRKTRGPTTTSTPCCAAPTAPACTPAGSFTSVAGAVRYNFASVAIASRTLTAWNPPTSTPPAGGWRSHPTARPPT